jgi:two-component system chemotaxis sensor kinase CheA
MTFDMSQFLATFYEESFEGLDIMETELLALDVGEADLETINTIFRAAHSIKGGSGTFGLNDVANFTHVMETLLDEMRDGKREVTQNAVNILLESVDVLREMLSTLQAEEELDVGSIATVKQKLDALLAGDSIEIPVAEAASSVKEDMVAAEPSVVISEGWVINFKPHIDMLQTGNDPVRMFRELDALGELSVVPDTSSLPDFFLMEPENSGLAWTLTLKGDVKKSSVEEVFDWVEDECDLTITAISSSNDESVAAKDADDGELNIDLLEQTFEMLAPQGEKLVARFYEELFKRYPKVKGLFLNTTPEKQQAKLLTALKLVVSNLRNQDVLVNALTEMGERHKKYGVQPEHYEAVTSTLLDVMEEFAGDAWTTTIGEAWKSALELVSNVMIAAYSKSDEATATTSGNSEYSENVITAAPKVEAILTTSAEAKLESAKAKRKVTTESSSIRVSIDKVDELINMVGELVITQSMLSQLGEGEEFGENEIEKLKDGLMQLERNTREMQENVMRIRMLPISFVFQRFPRLVHDLSGKLDKKIELVLSGESTELDKTVMEKIGDPLVHLVRNSLDHGIETPEARIDAGKPEIGEIHLNAYHEGGNIVIEITDDGAGLNLEKILSKAKSSGLAGDNDNLSDEEIADLIFRPGFSTADVVSDVSGRGVGMDVVRRNIRALGGTVDVKTQAGKGSVFTIRLPLTLAILDGQSVVIGDEVYIVPLVAIMESIQVDTALVSGITGQAEVYRLRDEYIPIVKLCDVFNVKPLHENMEDGLLVVVEAEGKKVALLVDDLLGQQQVVIKSLETNFKSIEGISGATILGDGTVALILDVTGLITISKQNTKTLNKKTTTSVAA